MTALLASLAIGSGIGLLILLMVRVVVSLMAEDGRWGEGEVVVRGGGPAEDDRDLGLGELHSSTLCRPLRSLPFPPAGWRL